MADISKIKTLNGTTYDIKDTVARNAINNAYNRPMYGIGTSDIAMRPLVPEARANRIWFLPADQIIIEKTTDGGATWSDAGISDTVKIQLFSGTRPSVTIPLLNSARSTNCGLRITFSAMKYNVPSGTAETEKYDYWNSTYVNRQERYTTLTEFWFWLGGNGDTIRAVVEAATGAKSTTWVKCFDTNDYSIGFTGWSGSDWCRFGSKTFGGGTNQTGNYWNWRITLWSRFAEGKSEFQQNTNQAVYHIAGYGESWWGASNNLMKNDHLYSFDYQQNATFPAKVTATSFEGTATNATTAVNVETQGSATNSTARHIWFSDSSTETKRAHSDNLKYTPSTNTVTANISGTAATVNGHTVDSDVPSNAVFTDTSDYDALSNRPSINGTTLSGNKTAAELGLAASSDIPTVPVQSVNGKTGAVVLSASDVGAGTYSKPSDGIPASDLASAVQTSLGKADTALQSVPSTYRTATAQDAIDIGMAKADEVGIVITGARPSTTVTAGQYVIVRNSTISGIADGLYTANATLSPSTDVTAANLTAVSGGGLNALQNKLFKTIYATVTGSVQAGENGWVYVPITIPTGYRMVAVNTLRFTGTNATYIVLRGFEISNSDSRVTVFFKCTTSQSTVDYTLQLWVACAKEELL